jgi:hypothetical protein
MEEVQFYQVVILLLLTENLNSVSKVPNAKEGKAEHPRRYHEDRGYWSGRQLLRLRSDAFKIFRCDL